MQDTIIELNYKSFGQGEPVIILHGLFGMLDNWQTIAKELADHYQVFLLDLRNHGKSPHTDEMNYELMCEDLLHFMDDHWIYRAKIIGHSMGGKLAMQFVKEHEDRVKKLVVVDIAPKRYKGNHMPIFEVLQGLDLEKLSSRNQIDDILQESIDSFGVRQFLMKNLKRNKEGGFRMKMNLSALYNNYNAILAGISFEETISVPSLFIRGAESPYVTDEDWKELKNSFSDSQLVTIDHAGHWVHADQKDQLVASLFEFLDH